MSVNQVLEQASPSALAGAIDENVCEFFRLFRHWSQADVHDGPDLLYTLTRIRYSVFNCALSARLESHVVDETIAAATARCQARQVPMLWITGPSTRPVDLGEHLMAHGFVHEEDEPQMAVDVRKMNEELLAPRDLAIEQVRDISTLARWCWVYNAGSGMPAFAEAAWLGLFSGIGLDPGGSMRHFIGKLDGVPVATSSLLLAGGVAGVGAVTTLPGVRRQGIGTAMTLAALREGRAAGYRFGVLGASDMGAGLYRKIGFRECCKQGVYVWTPAK